MLMSVILFTTVNLITVVVLVMF